MQKVPNNWHAIAMDSAYDIRKGMIDNDVDVIVAGDQTFIRFLMEGTEVIAPTGAQRVGSLVGGNDKAGGTLMVTAELNGSRLVLPFIVLDGKADGRLAKEYAKCAGSATIVFQKKHWFDVVSINEACVMS